METTENQNKNNNDQPVIEQEKITLLGKISAFFSQHKKNVFLGLGALIVIACVIFGLNYPFQSKFLGAGTYDLKADKFDGQGISPDSGFILHSRKALTSEEIKKIVRFVPEINFSSKKITQHKSFFNTALAAAEEEKTYAYELKPDAPLEKNQIYKATIADPAYADHEYGWAFQIKASFAVVKIHPKNKGIQVPTNSGIEVTFNRENLIKPEKYFEIVPAAEGSWESKGDTFIYKPKKLDPEKIYQVTIKKGLKADGSDEELAADFVFSFETAAEDLNRQQRSYFFMNDNFLEIAPGKNPVIRVSYEQGNEANPEASVYKFQTGEDYINSYQAGFDWELQWSSNQKGVLNEKAYLNSQKLLDFSLDIKEFNYAKFFEIPQSLTDGYYLLDVVFQGKHYGAWIEITPIFHYLSITNEKSLLWTYDFNKKSPLGQTNVAYLNKDGKAEAAGVTNADGLAEIKTPDELQYDAAGKTDFSPKFLKVEKDGYLPTYILANKNGSAGQGDWYWNYVSTDRYTYQMSDAVNFWGILKGRQEDLKNKKISVGIYGNNYGSYLEEGQSGSEALIKKEVMVSQFDTFSSTLSFKGFSPGIYSLRISVGEEELGMATFEILTYAKPAYQIITKPDKKNIYAGDKVNFNVKADFFDGTPVSGLDLKYNYYWKGSKNGVVKLNENGEGNVEIIPEYYADGRYPMSLNLTFSPVLAEEGEIYGRANALVFGPNLYLEGHQEKNKGSDYIFSAKVNKIIINEVGNESENNDFADDENYQRPEYIGESVADFPLQAKVVKMTNEKIEDGEYYDYVNKVTQKKYRYQQKQETIEELEGRTDAKGDWNFSKNFPSDDNSVSYKVIFSGKDSGDRKMEDTSYVYSYVSSNVKDFAVSLELDGEEYNKDYSVGDKIGLEFKILEGDLPEDAKILFYRYQNNIEKAQVLGARQFEEIFTENFSPSVSYQAVIFGPHGFQETNQVTAVLAKKDKKLTIDIQADKESYRPQEEVKLNMQVRDKDGQGTAAEINVSAVDEAMFHILEYNWQQGILESLYVPIHNEPVTDALQEFTLSKGGEMGGCFGKGTPVLMADKSSKAIENVKTGDQILTREKEQDNKNVLAVVQGISVHSVSEYLVINGKLEVTAEHRLFVNGNWREAGKIAVGDELVSASGEKQKVFSIKYARGANIPVYNITVGKYHTYFAGGYYVHNEEKGGGVRSEFMDTAVFQNVHADANGLANMVFKVPDNITSWRVTARAYEPNSIKAGETTKLVKTSIPFFIDATSANTYLVQDKPQIRLRFYGTDYQENQETEVSVKSETLGIDKTEKTTSNTIYVPLENLKAGEHEILISAKQGERVDKLVKKIKVVENYFRKIEATEYKLENKLTNVSGNKDGLTKLVFSDAGKGKFYGYLSRERYANGIRIEQNAGSFLAQNLLSKYFGEESVGTINLDSYYNENGGLGLFSYYGDSDLEVSAKMADVAQDYVAVSRLKNYFEDTIKNEQSDIHRIAKALYGLASLDEPVLVKIKTVLENSETNLEDKIYLNLALEKLGEKESARNFYLSQVRPEMEESGNEMYFNGDKDKDNNLKMTAKIAMLAEYADIKPDNGKLWNYISKSNTEKDLIDLEKIAVVKTGLAKSKQEKIQFSYSTPTRSKDVVLENGNSYSITLPWEELKDIKFKDVSGSISLVSYWEKEKNPADMKLDEKIKIERAYLYQDNRVAENFKEGDVIKIRLNPKIDYMVSDGIYQVVDYLPSGLRPITQTYSAGLNVREECDPIWYPDKVENNVVYFKISKDFATSARCQNRSLNYYARVVSKGSYEANPALIQSVDNSTSVNISEKKNIEIK